MISPRIQVRGRRFAINLSQRRNILAYSTQFTFCTSFVDVEQCMFTRARWLLDTRQHSSGKLVIGIAGTPGSGKTTMSDRLVKRLNEQRQDIAVSIPMDGFHYYRCDLDAMQDPAYAHAHRGAAFTFNASVFVECIRRLHDTAWQNQSIPFPGFDHGVGDPVQEEVWVQRSHKLVVCEGLYVLRDQSPWTDLDDIFVESWLLRANFELSMENVVQRKIKMGVKEKDARMKVASNDRLNAKEVYSMCRTPDFVLDYSRIQGAHS